jgi:hypothetical protein
MATGSKKFPACLVNGSEWRPPEPCETGSRCEAAGRCLPPPRKFRSRDALQAGCRKSRIGLKDPQS